MRSFTVRVLFTSLLVSTSGFFPALGAGADPLALALVKQQFINAKIVPDVIPSFSPVGTLQVVFSGNTTGITDGAPLAKASVQTQPTVTVAGVNNNTAKYTILMVDGDYVGAPNNSQGINLHWLENNVVISSAGTTSNTTAATIPYAGPAPASGTGPHRYTILLYQQPTNFTAPKTPAPDSGVNRVELATYVSAARLTGPLAGLYYTIEVGNATVTVGSTTAVNTATLSVSITQATGTTTTSPTHKGAAYKVGPASIGGSLAGLFGVVALLA